MPRITYNTILRVLVEELSLLFFKGVCVIVLDIGRVETNYKTINSP
jgi:hypothetical protein